MTRPNNETRTIFKHDMDRLIEQVDQLSEDRIARNAKIKALREALLELHSAGLAMVPHIQPLPASVSVRWDEAMGAADELLKEG